MGEDLAREGFAPSVQPLAHLQIPIKAVLPPMLPFIIFIPLIPISRFAVGMHQHVIPAEAFHEGDAGRLLVGGGEGEGVLGDRAGDYRGGSGHRVGD